MLGAFRLAEVDLADFQQGKVALAVLGRANLAGDRVTGTQVEATNLAGGNVGFSVQLKLFCLMLSLASSTTGSAEVSTRYTSCTFDDVFA